LVSQTHSHQEYNGDLISGMFQALESFINHLAYSKTYEHIQEITFGESLITYERMGSRRIGRSVLAVAISRKVKNPTYIHTYLRQILDTFIHMHKHHLKFFQGNTKPFLQFKRHLTGLNQRFMKIFGDKIEKKPAEIPGPSFLKDFSQFS